MRTTASRLADRLGQRRFERMVVKAVESLPSEIHALLDNVEIVIHDEPGPDLVEEHSDGPFGFYEGIPITDRTSAYGMTVPDKITIFRGPIERAAMSPADLMTEIRTTVIHELAHHFGMDEDHIERLGYG